MLDFFKVSQVDLNGNPDFLYEKISGSRRWSNFFWGVVILLGSSGFLSVGLSSYFNFNLIPFLDSSGIIFFPQGIVMCFYGFFGLLISLYQWLTIFWRVGEGYNEFNKEKRILKIFRFGFPGKNREINFVYSFDEVDSIKIEIKDGIAPKRIIYNKGDIPLTEVGTPLSLSEVEKRASRLAEILQVPIEGL
nr:photosystem I assembly protein Ycf4 [Eutreptiella sp. CCMP1594]